jgi:leader peptidase (prepilin peptidase)/N-methyltransferase
MIIHRLPIMLNTAWTTQCKTWLNISQSSSTSKTINFFFPRSFCPTCNNTIPLWHNIPLLSYAICKGRCYACHTSIPKRYAYVELLTLLLFLVAGFYFQFTLTLVFALIFIALLICITFIDMAHQLLPDELSLTLLWTGLIANTQSLFTSLPNAVFSAAGAYLILWALMKIFFILTRKIGMGNGDFKLFAAFGAWFGWTMLPFILFFASLIGAIIGITYLKITKKSKDTPIPFGPFLCLSGFLALFFGQSIINWYLM